MRRLVLAAALLVVAPASRAAEPPALLGRWTMEADPSQQLELKAGGQGSLAGQPLTWSASGAQLTITNPSGTDTTAWRVAGARLILTAAFGAEIAFLRAEPARKAGPLERAARGSAATAPSAGGPGANGAAAGPAASPVDDQLRQLLLSSAWCSFSYSGSSSGLSGSSSSSRVVFARDGTARRTTGRESSSAGSGGTYAGQSQGGGAMRWQVQGGRLYVDSGQGAADVNLTVTRNSSGYFILKAAGVEYSMCN